MEEDNIEIKGKDGNTELEIFYDRALSPKIRVTIKEKKKDSSSTTTYYFENKEKNKKRK